MTEDSAKRSGASVRSFVMGREWWIAASYAALIAWFVFSRVCYHGGLAPFLDADSYKYLALADAMWFERPRPTLFSTQVLTDGALHAVPGYGWLIHSVWMLVGENSLRAVLVVQSAIALAGYLAGANLLARWVGPKTGLAALAVLTLSPSLVWIEHMVMPDSLAAPLTFLGVWLAVVSSEVPRSSGRGLAVLVAGALTGAGVLLRTASQVYVWTPLGAVVAGRRNWIQGAALAGVFLFGAWLATAAWLAENYRLHGVYGMSASTGRNLYFSALWTDTIDRRSMAAELGVRTWPDSRGAFELSDRSVQRLHAAGLTMAEVDRELRSRALSAWRTRELGQLLSERIDNLGGLFSAGFTAGQLLRPLRGGLDFYTNGYIRSEKPIAAWEKRLEYELSADLKSKIRLARSQPSGLSFANSWTRLFALEGFPLLVLYLVSLPIVAICAERRWWIVWTFGLPPLSFLAVYFILGAPLYRYQVGLHPFLLLTIVAAAASLAARVVSRVRGDSSASRREPPVEVLEEPAS